MKILGKLEKNREFWFLIIISVVFFFLRFPSLFEPNWYGDEGIYQTLGIGMNGGRLLYRDIFDNKPPLLYFVYSLVSSDQFMTRFLSLIVGILTVLAFFLLARKIFENKKITFVATAFFTVLFGLPLIEGNIANAENFMLLPNILAGLLVLNSLDEKLWITKYKLLLTAGFLLGISFLFKIVAIFDFAAFLLFLFFVNYTKNLLDIFKEKNFISEVKNLLPFILGFFVPIIFVTLIFIFFGAFSNFFRATFFSNIGYIGYGNKFIIPQGFLIIKLILLALFSLFIFYKRKNFGHYFTFVSLWFAFSLFNAYFSQRPYTHYVLVLLPSFCLMAGLFFLNKKFSKLSGVITISSFIAVLLSFTFYAKTIFYYQNFLSFITNGKSVNAYQRFFDKNTPNDYEIASFINLHAKKDDNIFIWGNNAQVYKLTNKLPPGKYTVSYHILNYKDGYLDTKAGIERKKPRFIIIMPNVPVFPFSLSGYFERLNINGIEIYEKIRQQY